MTDRKKASKTVFPPISDAAQTSRRGSNGAIEATAKHYSVNNRFKEIGASPPSNAKESTYINSQSRYGVDSGQVSLSNRNHYNNLRKSEDHFT